MYTVTEGWRLHKETKDTQRPSYHMEPYYHPRKKTPPDRLFHPSFVRED